VESGRIVDRPGLAVRTALREIVAGLGKPVVLTPHQNILVADLSDGEVSRVESILRSHGMRTVEELSAARRYAIACVALPTCGLALTDAERVLPDVIGRFEAELEALGVGDEPITIRMTGCPNGCARPYSADVAFVGRRPGVYQVYVGGTLRGDRVADLYAADVPMDALVETLRPLLRSWAANRADGEGLGDYYQRVLGRTAPRLSVTGLEEPTSKGLRIP
jgi:sulfite reductase beta subunit-like hemoprotein